ncbi:hypothetical protein ACFQ9V_01020 [Leifsonia sp. NPDC056665]|uniref:hypothetical protein n=1 Tax=Leifsonia sp. NPDC056665 TaxID=3345901 RepID=UPI00367766A6
MAIDRLFRVLGALPATLPDENNLKPSETPTAQAIVAVFDALEWVHSLHDHLRSDGRYGRPSDLDEDLGNYVEGLIGARNASHHGLRRVVGFVPVAMSVYKVEGGRGVHTGSYAEASPLLQLRWLRFLPQRPEEIHQEKPILRVTDQITAYEEHLAGRDVRNRFTAALAFFFDALEGRRSSPDTLHGPAENPPPIDPAVIRRSMLSREDPDRVDP